METATNKINYKETKCKSCKYSAICSALEDEQVRKECTDYKKGRSIGYFNILDLKTDDDFK